MTSREKRELDSSYAAEVDSLDEQRWNQILQEFDDANIYQTWSYGAVMSSSRNMSHLILRKEGDIVAISQARIARLPITNVGIAYVHWGPLWRRGVTETNVETFRQAVRALRNEYVCARGLVLRLFPNLSDDDNPSFSITLAEEGFTPSGTSMRGRTILMDLCPSLADLRVGMKRNWKRNLKVAEEGGLEITEGSSEEFLEAFIKIYKETVARKKFMEPNDINKFVSIQAQLPEHLKMQVLLCKSGVDVCAGLVWSALGKAGIELFAATSDVGIASRGSYLLRWKLIEKLKRSCFTEYNLNGINPIKNPGGYKFKSELAGKNGKEVSYLGRFDSHTNVVSYWCIQLGDRLRNLYRVLRR